MHYLIEVFRPPDADETALADRMLCISADKVIIKVFDHECEHDIQAKIRAEMAASAIKQATGYRVYKLIAEYNKSTK